MQLEREKLINDNIRLVYFVYQKLEKTPFVENNKEDIISEGLLGLVKAANKYDFENGSKFATFASICIRNDMLLFIRRNAKTYMKEISLDTPIGYDEEQEITLKNTIPSDTDVEKEVLAKIMMEKFIEEQKPKDQIILKEKLKDKPRKEIAKELGVSCSYVGRRISNLKKTYHN